MLRKLAKFASLVLVLLATTAVTTASWWQYHRPEVPEELLRD